MVYITRIRFENLESPAIGIGESLPRISWSYGLDNPQEDWVQECYEIEVSGRAGEGQISNKVNSEDCEFMPWPFRPLASGEEANVRIRAFGSDGRWTAWSVAATVEAGLLNAQDWNCQLIEPGDPYPQESPHRPVVLNRLFKLAAEVKKARLYITAHGVYQVHLDHIPVGDMVMNPGWTSYNHRLTYQTFPLDLAAGEHSLDMFLAEGWYCGRLGYGGGRCNIYGNRIGLIAQLVIDYEDGHREIVGTDHTWRWTYGPIVQSSIYDGEVFRSSKCMGKEQWHAMQAKPFHDRLVAPLGPPIRRVMTLPAREIMISPSGKTIVDFGQNFVGRVRLRIRVAPSHATGSCIKLRHAEVLEDGDIVTRTLRDAKAEDHIHWEGDRSGSWEPRFTFHGFRYVEVEGYPGRFQVDDIKGVVLQTDMVKTGHFSCSNEALNKLHKNIEWSMRGNFLAIPTDCPQRDERLGWTGDLNVFVDTANFLFDTSGMLGSWLEDLALEQRDAGGIVPLVVPTVLPHHTKDAHAIWGDASIMVPWSIYQANGDVTILTKQRDSMESWLNAIPRRQNGLWNYKAPWKLGDWLDPLSPPADPGNATTDPELVANIFLIHVTRLMGKITTILNGPPAGEVYSDQVPGLLDAFAAEYMAPSGLLVADTQTAYALALHFDIYRDAQQKQRAIDRLVANVISKSHFKIATGFAGTPFILHALTKSGHANIAYRMLLERKCPSWLYPVTMGATTVWERWDSMLPDGRVNPGDMTSFNHYALGAVADWMHKVIAGMRAVEPGWKVWRVDPVAGGALEWAEASYLSPYGQCKVRWDIREGEMGKKRFALKIEVPPNTRCEVKLPSEREDELVVGSGVHEFGCVYVPQDWPVRAKYPRHMEADDDIPENHQ